VARFHREHAQLYGYSNPGRDVEIVTIRVRARTRTAKPKLARGSYGAGRPQMRRVWADETWRRVHVWKRENMGAGPQRGPALILDYGSTTLVPAGWRFRVDRAGNLIITL
jgi:N-methylhydantoinase A